MWYVIFSIKERHIIGSSKNINFVNDFLSKIGFDCEVITTEMDMSAYELDESHFYKKS